MYYGIIRSDYVYPDAVTDSDVEIKFVAPLQVISNRPVSGSDTISLMRVVLVHPNQRWELECGLEPDKASEVLVHQAKNGTWNPFPVRFPQIFRPPNLIPTQITDSPAQALIVAGQARYKNDTTVTVSGYYGTPVGPGEFVQFANHSKVYLLLSVTGPVNGVQTITVFPALREDVPLETMMRHGGQTLGWFRYDLSMQMGIKYVDGILADPGVVRMVEAL